MKLEELVKEVEAQQKETMKQLRHDYVKGMEDCKSGIYDKWFRYNRNDDGWSYDMGWMAQNEKTKNDSVRFINCE